MKVYFEENPEDLDMEEYLSLVPEWQRAVLKNFASELESMGKIVHPDARRIENNRWSLWVRSEGQEAINHVCYLAREKSANMSSLASLLLDTNHRPTTTNTPEKTLGRSLMILRPHTRPGEEEDIYQSPESYALMLDGIMSRAFLEVISKIQSGVVDSNNYSTQSNGDISIHIHRPDLAYGVHLECKARWI